jgi:hypothetical protein
MPFFTLMPPPLMPPLFHFRCFSIIFRFRHFAFDITPFLLISLPPPFHFDAFHCHDDDDFPLSRHFSAFCLITPRRSAQRERCARAQRRAREGRARSSVARRRQRKCCACGADAARARYARRAARGVARCEDARAMRYYAAWHAAPLLIHFRYVFPFDFFIFADFPLRLIFADFLLRYFLPIFDFFRFRRHDFRFIAIDFHAAITPLLIFFAFARYAMPLIRHARLRH